MKKNMKVQSYETYYKLTNQKLRDCRGFQWKVGVQVTKSGIGVLCGPGWIPLYTDTLLAVLHNPIHADFKDPRLWKAKVGGKSLNDNGMQTGWTECTLIKEIPLPKISLTQKIAYGILVAKEVYKDISFNRWADDWLSGKDRTAKSAWAVVEAAWSVRAAVWTVREDWKANAAEAAAWAADAAWAAKAVVAAAWAAKAAAAAKAADAAAWAVDAATRDNFEKTLIRCAKKAMKIK